MRNIFYYGTAIGIIGIAEENNFITDIFFGKVSDESKFIVNETPLLIEAGKQIEEYFKGIRKKFDLPLMPIGTEFQKKVWAALEDIPYGETRSYKDIAVAVGNEKGSRAIGMANNRNPISIIIPCHRVIGSDGKLVGYGGGMKTKEYLLNLEKQFKNN
jgi:methylated-DNA-[protein]-cysteine S-methyltransferase